MLLMLIPLSTGGKQGDGYVKYALIEAADYPLIKDRKWYAKWGVNTKGFYAQANLPKGARGQASEQMHRRILGLSPGDGREGDHINHNTLDNRRANLRIASREQNSHNMRLRRANRSGLRGVNWDPKRERWRARLKDSGIDRHLGYFKTKEAAAAAYDTAVVDQRGDFGQLTAAR